MQLHLHGRRDDMTSTARRLETCITDVGQWMSANRLKLNTEKTELLTCIWRPSRGWPRSNFAEIFGTEKLESVSYRVVLFVW